ncbi:MAG: S41 family peptidase [Tidjanibacter sp.]|nr:S41 family peptidase [Tidjanibacter sp.]
MRVFKRLKYVMVGVVATLGVLFLGAAAKSNTFDLGKNIELLVGMFRGVELFYVDDVEPDKLMNAAAEGMSSILDPYTEFLAGDKMEQFTTLTTGRYGGIGSLIRASGDYVKFAEPYEGSPADRAGIRPGDRIVAIDGRDAKGYTTDTVSLLLKGEPGSIIRLTVEKFPSEKREELKLRRETINLPGVPYYGFVADSIGYIKHDDFTEDCSRDMRKAYESLRSQGIKGVILDYRGNGGGILQEAVKILSMFVPKGTEVVSTRAKDARNNIVFATENEPIDLSTPIVVLTDSGTASAAEIVSGALQDLDRAVLVGQRTFGKGLVQTPYPLGYNSYVKITTAKYYLPSGRCIQAIDYAHRNEDGSVGYVPDSLVREFSTRAGRKVFDGGGVVPDRKTEPRYIGSFAVALYAAGLVDDFVEDYCRRHYETLRVVPTEYVFDDKAYAEFETFMTDKTVPWQSEAAAAWRRFKTAAQRERRTEDIEQNIKAIEENLDSDTRENLAFYSDEIGDIIEQEIVLRYNYNSGAIRHHIASDKEVAEAVSILNQQPLYDQITAADKVPEK